MGSCNWWRGHIKASDVIAEVNIWIIWRHLHNLFNTTTVLLWYKIEDWFLGNFDNTFVLQNFVLHRLKISSKNRLTLLIGYHFGSWLKELLHIFLFFWFAVVLYTDPENCELPHHVVAKRHCQIQINFIFIFCLFYKLLFILLPSDC